MTQAQQNRPNHDGEARSPRTVTRDARIALACAAVFVVGLVIALVSMASGPEPSPPLSPYQEGVNTARFYLSGGDTRGLARETCLADAPNYVAPSEIAEFQRGCRRAALAWRDQEWPMGGPLRGD